MFVLNDSKYYSSDKIGVLAGFGTKQFGEGTDQNLVYKYFKNQIPSLSIVFPSQTHSANVVVYKKSSSKKISHHLSTIENCDGVVTQERNVILTVITADCLPIVYSDEKAGIIGISHQGWKGTLNRLPAKMIGKMINLGSSIKNICCAFGPAINDCCYEIYGERLEQQFQKEFQDESIFRKENGKYFLNLYKANYLSLIEMGIPKNNIDYFPFCTSCNKDKFWSYRRDKKILGEMVSFVMI